METEAAPGIDLPPTLGEGCTILYVDLKEETTCVAEDGSFKVLYETDGAKKYNGRIRIVCKCSASGHPKKRKTNEDDESIDTFSTLFTKQRRRVSLRIGCPWKIVAWANTKPLSDDTLLTISKVSNVHTCKPSVERLEEVQERTTESTHLPRRTLESLYTLVRYGADTKRIRLFIINEKLNLKTDAQSIVNLKLLMLRRTGGLPQKLHKHTSTSLQTDITSICKVDEITDVFAELQKIEQPEGLRIRHALEFTRLQIKGFDYRLRVGEDGELLSCIWMTARMRARLRLYGGLIFLDGKAKANIEEWPIFFPTILDCYSKAHRVAVAVSYVEDGATTQFVITQLRSMCPEWSETPTIQMDSKVSSDTIQEVCPFANVQVCTFHWLTLVVPKVCQLLILRYPVFSLCLLSVMS